MKELMFLNFMQFLTFRILLQNPPCQNRIFDKLISSKLMPSDASFWKSISKRNRKLRSTLIASKY